MATDNLGPLLPKWITGIRPYLTKDVGRMVVMPGSDKVYDDCCAGQLWIRVVSIVGDSSLSNPAMQPCSQMYQVRIGIGVARCAHTVNDEAGAPTPAEMTADAMQAYQDRADLTKGIIEVIYNPYMSGDRSDMGRFRIETWLPDGPQGGCVGGEITCSFNLALCD